MSRTTHLTSPDGPRLAARPGLRRALAITAATLLLGAVAAPAMADEPTGSSSSSPSPSPRVSVAVDGDQVTLTTDLASAQAACARLDTVREHLLRVRDRINADEDTRGSAAWLRQRAAHAAGEGRDDQSRLLTQRAERRAGWLDDVDGAIGRLDTAGAQVCAALPDAGE